MLKLPNFFYSQPSTLPKEALAKFDLSTTFGLSFMMSSVAPTQSSTSYAYLITKIRNRDLITTANNCRYQNVKKFITLDFGCKSP